MSDRLIVFSRYPRLGKVKTRLMPLLGPKGCLRLHQSLLLDTLERLSRRGTPIHLFVADCAPDELRGLPSEFELPSQVRIHHQSGGDLGERMWNAFMELFRDGDRVILLGTDSPSLPLRYLDEAWDRLLERPVVIGPAEDGGYYLLGLSQARPELFEGIDWGTSRLLAQTLAKLDPRDLHLLPSWYDVDTPSDLSRLEQDLTEQFEGFPARTLRSLRSRRG